MRCHYSLLFPEIDHIPGMIGEKNGFGHEPFVGSGAAPFFGGNHREQVSAVVAFVEVVGIADDRVKVELRLVNPFRYFHPALQFIGLIHQGLHLPVKLVHLSLRLLAHGGYGATLYFTCIFRPDHSAAQGMRIRQQARIFGYFIFINRIPIFVGHTYPGHTGKKQVK